MNDNFPAGALTRDSFHTMFSTWWLLLRACGWFVVWIFIFIPLILLCVIVASMRAGVGTEAKIRGEQGLLLLATHPMRGLKNWLEWGAQLHRLEKLEKQVVTSNPNTGRV
jgi:hypothetical protein